MRSRAVRTRAVVSQEGRQVRAAGCSPPLAECAQAALLEARHTAYIPQTPSPQEQKV